MINSKFKLKKLFVIGGEVYFYSIMALIIFLVFLPSPIPITPSIIGISVLPISHGAYWFITDYIVLILLSPFLNRFIHRLSKDIFLKLLAVLLIIWCIYPTFTAKSFDFSGIAWFVVLYLIGSFIKLHINIDKIDFKKLLSVFLISTFIIYLGSSLIAYLSMLFDIPGLLGGGITITGLYTFFSAQYNIFVLITSISLFLLFLKRKEFSNKYVNYVAGSVLGVYLIHENVLIKSFIWKSVNITSYYNSAYLILITIFLTLAIFVICIGIDIIRRETVERLWIWILDRKLGSFSKYIYIGNSICWRISLNTI